MPLAASPTTFLADFEVDCRRCGHSPCVVVRSTIFTDTELCGPHFFGDRLMIDPELWNEPKEDTE